MNKYRLFILSALTSFTLISFAASYKVSAQDQAKMQEEAENWIDDMPTGIQDRLSDAVAHALRGFYSEINFFRSYKDTIGLEKYPVSIEEIKVGKNSNIPSRLYKPQSKDAASLPLLIYFHGGGWSMGSIDTSDRFCRALVAEGNVTIISVEYPLSPENPYPAALNVCVDAVESIFEKANDRGFSKDLISMGGDGAGGNLALTTLSKLPNDIKIHSLVLFYPLIQATGSLDADKKRTFGRGYGFDSRLWEAYVEAYNAKADELSLELPSTLLICAGRDIVIAEEQAFSVQDNITYVEFTDALHGFISDGHQPTAFQKAVEFTDNFLAK